MPTKKTNKRLPKSATLYPGLLITREWLNDLARSIYDSHNKRFLRLCDGTLQNGPDPTDKTRSMHCGLGELYYAMTGLQPFQTRVTEDDVVELALKLSTIPNAKEVLKESIAAVKAMQVSDDVKDDLISTLNCADEDDIATNSTEFCRVLNEIPKSNDDGLGNGTEPGDEGGMCTLVNFKERSKRVAAKLRQAAKLLPKE